MTRFRAVTLITALLGAIPVLAAERATAVFAGGCFWCMEADFEKLDGVHDVVSGYTGGKRANPSYAQVSSGATRHVEAVRVIYDPELISYEQLLEYFWVNVDPTVDDRQFCDTGRHYRPAIFPRDEAQETAARASLQRVREADGPSPIKVTVERAGRFWDAEQYHQDYYRKNPVRYNFYRLSCRRDARLTELWGERAGQKPD